MSSSRTQSPSPRGGKSPVSCAGTFSPQAANPGLFPENVATMNDASIVRAVIVDAMKRCPKSRAIIADEMSHLTGTTVTERMLNAFAADSREDVRFPAELERAFCAAVGDNRLLVCKAEAAGLHVIDDAGAALMELGRQYLIRKRAEAEVSNLERRLEGVEL